VYVLNQESAYDFYVNKLGFKVHTDAPMGPGNRWLTELRQSCFDTLRTSSDLLRHGLPRS